MIAKGAFLSDPVHWVKKSHSVWTGHDAIAATDAPFAVDKHDTVQCLVGRTHRANLDTGWFDTLVTEFRHEETLGDLVSRYLVFSNFSIGVPVSAAERRFYMGLTVFHEDIAFDPCPGNRGIVGDFIFILAGLDTKSASNAFLCIDQEDPADGRITCISLYLRRA
jgi:hypothetical protein